MALKAVLASLDEVAENLRPLYKEDAGKFFLDAEGFEEHPGTTNLRRALDTERKARTEAARQAAELKDKIGDMDPDAAREAIKKIRDLEEQAQLGEIPEKFKKQFDEAVAVRTKSISDDFEAQKKAFNRTIEQATKDNQSLKSDLEVLKIDDAIRAEATKAGLHEWAIEDAVMHGRRVYRLGKDGTPVPMKDDQVIYGKNPNEPKPIAEWLSEKVTEKPGWVKGSSGAGTENVASRGKATGVVKLTRDQARNPDAYRLAKEQASKAGVDLVVADS